MYISTLYERTQFKCETKTVSKAFITALIIVIFLLEISHQMCGNELALLHEVNES